MANNRDEELEAAKANDHQAAAEEAASDDTDDLDLDGLDLSVETVEERISPSETNVFDK